MMEVPLPSRYWCYRETFGPFYSQILGENQGKSRPTRKILPGVSGVLTGMSLLSYLTSALPGL